MVQLFSLRFENKWMRDWTLSRHSCGPTIRYHSVTVRVFFFVLNQSCNNIHPSLGRIKTSNTFRDPGILMCVCDGICELLLLCTYILIYVHCDWKHSKNSATL